MGSDLSALPTRLGGMGIPNPTKTCDEKFMSSEWISALLTALILQQKKIFPSSVASELTSIKSKIKAQRQRAQADEAARLREALPPNKPWYTVRSEKSILHWLAVIPLTEHGFTVHKGAFRDAINLRYG